MGAWLFVADMRMRMRRHAAIFHTGAGSRGRRELAVELEDDDRQQRQQCHRM